MTELKHAASVSGTGFWRSYAGACSCAAYTTWDLNLERSNEPDDSIWPQGAVLDTTSTGPIQVEGEQVIIRYALDGARREIVYSILPNE